jgi:hypothetical protein
LLGLIRTLYIIIATLVVVGGYVASQYAFFQGDPAQYAARVDSPAMRLVSALILVGGIALVWLGRNAEEPQ